MNHKRTTMTSIVLATAMLFSLFAVVSSATGVSGTVMTGTGPATTYSTIGSPELVAVDTSGHVWWNQSFYQSSWTSLGGSATSSPAATTPSMVNGVIDVFVRGTDGAVWYKSTTNNGTSWSSWHSLGGQLASGTGPAACSWGAGRLDVFVQGTNGALYHKWSANFGATWSGWENLGGKLTASPAASSANNQIGVYVRGTDGSCWHKDWTGTAWSSWHSLGGQLAPNTGPAAGGGFVQGTDHQLWWQVEAGSAWSRLPACPEVLSASSPAPVMSYLGHTEVWVSTTSGNLMYCYVTATWTGTAWVTSWTWYSATSPP
jgi:hypothetical protein